MKDFGQLYLRKEDTANNNYNPLLYMTQAVKQQILEMQKIAFTSLNIINFASVLLTAPLTTITASLQLSVKPHKTLYQEPISKSTQVARINTALTLQQKRKMELMLRAGGQSKPYTAPIYQGYRGVIKGLVSQGWRSFFKGLGFRSIHQLGHYFAFYEVSLMQSNKKGIMQALTTGSQLMKIYIVQSCCDTLLNLLHMGQNRYILQNNIPEFRVFRNASRAIRKMLMRREIFTASAYHFFYNFAQIFVRLPLYLGLDNAPAFIGILYPTQVLMYPLNTAFRRLLCQHTQIPGMIPLRYSGLWHALRLIASQQGILGLYRGFGLHHLSLAIKYGCLITLKPFVSALMSME